MTDVTHLLAAPAIVRTVAIGLIKPWGHPFKVTAKGVSTDKVTVQWSLLAPFAFMAVATILGMIVNMSPHSPLNGTPGYAINVFWSIFNVAVLSIACAVCVELPKRRSDERFASGERASVLLSGQSSFECVVLDISLGGARLSCEGGWNIDFEAGELTLDHGAIQLPFVKLRLGHEGALSIQFKHSDASRRTLTRKLFTGGYDNEVDRVNVGRTLFGAARKVFQ